MDHYETELTLDEASDLLHEVDPEAAERYDDIRDREFDRSLEAYLRTTNDPIRGERYELLLEKTPDFYGQRIGKPEPLTRSLAFLDKTFGVGPGPCKGAWHHYHFSGSIPDDENSDQRGEH